MPNPHHLTIVGAGNVGLWAAINLVPRIRQEPGATWRIVVIDPDQATDRDHLKGMHASFCDGSLNKAVAMKRFLTHAFGEDVGDVIVPVAAHAESVPGLLRLGPTLIGTDSFGSAAFSSAAASLGGVWQARLSTGKQDDAETWRVAVYPPGSGTLADGYDDAAWSRSREVASCVTGELLDRMLSQRSPHGGESRRGSVGQPDVAASARAQVRPHSRRRNHQRE